MTKDKGGPAFPFEYHNQTNSYQDGFFDTGRLAPDASQQFAGMSLRDYFAAKALAGMLADSELKTTREDFAERSYAMADAMILERAK